MQVHGLSFATLLLKYEELCGPLQLVHMTSYTPQSPGDYGATLHTIANQFHRHIHTQKIRLSHDVM